MEIYVFPPGNSQVTDRALSIQGARAGEFAGTGDKGLHAPPGNGGDSYHQTTAYPVSAVI